MANFALKEGKTTLASVKFVMSLSDFSTFPHGVESIAVGWPSTYANDKVWTRLSSLVETKPSTAKKTFKEETAKTRRR